MGDRAFHARVAGISGSETMAPIPCLNTRIQIHQQSSGNGIFIGSGAAQRWSANLAAWSPHLQTEVSPTYLPSA